MAKEKENEIREGQPDKDRKPLGREKAAYPKMDTEDKQHKDQPEFIDNEPNKKKENDE